MSIDYFIIGKRIRYYRQTKRITQEELAFRIGSSAAYISNIESGKKKPSLQKLDQISDVLKITVNDLIYNPDLHTDSLSPPELSELISRCSVDKQELILKNISEIIKSFIT